MTNIPIFELDSGQTGRGLISTSSPNRLLSACDSGGAGRGFAFRFLRGNNSFLLFIILTNDESHEQQEK